ncbi:cytochrome b561 and DOMON domain-containing protein At3g61750-like isoform X2 [Magnolia sinica]|uniref:cytochrome b561 and DOMON domain-containing protein At3g61750-like isoform X2 n=1 Tax=Magnolia sinica TaxID=86752 RepID=UPI002658C588|nr:cytochrome b561 and DOMON domain-containing protein At3g61750-like isoform X2 [Magnolia sinica]
MAGEDSREKSLSRFFSSAVIIALFLLFLSSVEKIAVNAQTDSCNLDLSSFLPSPFNVSSDLICRRVWNNFVLRYSQSTDGALRIVLSTVYTSGWVGMGFSKDGMMVGSSAMVGWIAKDGKANIKQYLLSGTSPLQVIADKGQLQATSPPVVVLNGVNIFLAFQLKFSTPLSMQPLIFAFASATPNQYQLAVHDDKASVVFDFSAGTSSVSSSASQLKMNHGALAVFGWGVLLPVGAIIARYCRQWDPQWFYLHSVIQFVGFLFGLASVVAGISLYNKIHANVPEHRALGIIIFVLGTLQIRALDYQKMAPLVRIEKHVSCAEHRVGLSSSIC